MMMLIRKTNFVMKNPYQDIMFHYYGGIKYSQYDEKLQVTDSIAQNEHGKEIEQSKHELIK
jgi:hypothetical protein